MKYSERQLCVLIFLIWTCLICSTMTDCGVTSHTEFKNSHINLRHHCPLLTKTHFQTGSGSTAVERRFISKYDIIQVFQSVERKYFTINALQYCIAYIKIANYYCCLFSPIFSCGQCIYSEKSSVLYYSHSPVWYRSTDRLCDVCKHLCLLSVGQKGSDFITMAQSFEVCLCAFL